MPLIPGAGRASIGRNIHELSQAGGRSRKQILAIALENARRTGGGAGAPAPMAEGGMASECHYAEGGTVQHHHETPAGAETIHEHHYAHGGAVVHRHHMADGRVLVHRFEPDGTHSMSEPATEPDSDDADFFARPPPHRLVRRP